jgi:hypothetical protein
VLAAALACGSDSVFALPIGNESAAADASAAEQQVYEAIAEDCSSGEVALDQDWQNLDSPQAVLLYEAAVQACQGNTEVASQILEDVDPSELDDESLACITYKEVVGYVTDAPADSIACTGVGPAPTWPAGQPPAERVDPRGGILIDGSTTTNGGDTTTTSGEGSTTTSTSSTTSPSPATTGAISGSGDGDVSVDG